MAAFGHLEFLNFDIVHIEHNVKNEIMIWGIHYFITKLKKKIDVIPRGPFNYVLFKYFHML